MRRDEGTRDAEFAGQRPRLLGVAYRVLGSMADAEDVVQEAWLRWSRTTADVADPRAYLTTVVTRLALDRWRRVRAQREVYVGSWLPEPVTTAPGGGDPAAAAEMADSLSTALLVVLEALSPLERAAFVLREVFHRPYAEVATTLAREEAAVRQLVRRARLRVDSGYTRYEVDRDTHAQVVRRFLAACRGADTTALLDVLAPDVVVVSDGGGQAPAHPRPVHGRERVARLLRGIAAKTPPATVFGLEEFNGRIGLVGRLDGAPTSAIAVRTSDDLVVSLHVVANPDKLTRLAAGPMVMV